MGKQHWLDTERSKYVQLHYVRARKDYPEDKIKKGELYYWYMLDFQKRIRSKTRPTKRDLTTSKFLRAIYQIEHEIKAWNPETFQGWEDLEVIGRLEALQEELVDKYDNCPDNFKNSRIGERIMDRMQCLASYIFQVQHCSEEPQSLWGKNTPPEVKKILIETFWTCEHGFE